MQVKFIKFISFTVFSSLCLILVLSGCSKEKSLEGQLVNQFSNASRDNSYEKYGTFFNNSYKVDYIKSSDSSGTIVQPLVLSAFRTVFATTAGSIHLLYDDAVQWTYKLEKNELIVAGMCADKEQNIYAVSNAGKVYSIDKDGKLRWKNNFIDSITKTTIFSDLLALEDGIVIGATNGIVRKYDFNGKMLWQIQNSTEPTKYFAANEQGLLAIPFTNNEFGKSDTLWLVEPNGNVKSKIGFDGIRLIKTPVFHKNNIYLIGMMDTNGTRTSFLYSLDLSGKIIWQKEIQTPARFLSVSEEGKIYVVAYHTGMGEYLSAVFCFSSEGKEEWKQFIDVLIPSPVIISEKLLAFAGYGKDVPGFYFYRPDGTLAKVISLHDAPNFLAVPTVRPDRVIILPGSEKLCLIKIDEPLINKYLPW